MRGTATVAGILSGSAAPMSGTEGTALNNVQVASFSTVFTADTAATFTATIDWGDGSGSAGAITGSAGNFGVGGSHTYADEGTFNFTVTVTNDARGATPLALQEKARAHSPLLNF